MYGADIIAIIMLVTIIVAIIVYLLHWLYRHSSKDLSFVRTGFGGEKVVMGGGALVLPIVHDVTEVSMNTLRIEVRRAGEKSLITPQPDAGRSQRRVLRSRHSDGGVGRGRRAHARQPDAQPGKPQGSRAGPVSSTRWAPSRRR